MVSTLTGPFLLSGVVVDCVSASVGLAIARGPCTAEDLLHQGDTAMYAAKRAGRGGYRIAELPAAQPGSRRV
jgi:GGDEF domain-containing protein